MHNQNWNQLLSSRSNLLDGPYSRKNDDRLTPTRVIGALAFAGAFVLSYALLATYF